MEARQASEWQHLVDSIRRLAPHRASQLTIFSAHDTPEQKLIYLVVLQAEGGLRPELTSVTGWCKSSPSSAIEAGEGDPVSVKAEVNVLWTDYRDRGIDQDALLFIECDASPLLRAHYNLSSALPSTFSASEAHALPSVTYDFAFEHNLGEVETSTSGKVPLVQWYTAVDVQLDLDKPLEKTSMTACLSPAFYPKGKMPLLKWLEWREHMRRIGTERVAWYGREEGMGRFVDEYNKLSGQKDVFRCVSCSVAIWTCVCSNGGNGC